MWMEALDERANARDIQIAAEQEKVLVQLADTVAFERQEFYKLFSLPNPDPVAVAQLQEISKKNKDYVDALYALLKSKQTDLQLEESLFEALKNAGSIDIGRNHKYEGHGHAGIMDNNGRMHEEQSQVGAGSDKPQTASMEGMSHSDKHNPYNKPAGHEAAKKVANLKASIGDIVNYLSEDKAALYAVLLKPRGSRTPKNGMRKFHDFTNTIESIDSLRRSLQIAPIASKREFYIHSSLKDVIWNFREAVSQINSLLGGIVVLDGASEVLAQTRHHSDMLMEQNVRVDFAWRELVKLSDSSKDEAVQSQTLMATYWYAQHFKNLSARLAASSRYNAVTVSELRRWYDSSQQLLRRANGIRAGSNKATLSSIQSVEREAILHLVLVSILVLFTLAMAFASWLFFRKAYRQAHQDELTKLGNRRMFCLDLSHQISLAERTETEIAILMIDLDKFKYINDSMGHAAGDRLLQEVSARIKAASKDHRSIARLGGDEFAVSFVGQDVATVRENAEAISHSLATPFYINEAVFNIGSSIGVARFPQDADSHSSLIQAADVAMYCAKKSGTNRIVTYDGELDQDMCANAKLVTDIKSAIQQNQFELYYQPQFNLGLKKVVSVEALIRWNHPERGFIPPNDFIPLAEEHGLLPIIGDWVINEACRQASVWLYTDSAPLRVAVNISADHFFQPGFVQKVLDCLAKHKIPAELLEIEVTESVAVNDMNVVVESLTKLRDSSIHIALDDFGTGYSSLSYLQDLPLDTLKIDKTFIQKLLQGNLQHDAITEAIASLGESLMLETVAEGVETADQLSAVSNMRVSVVQGYYYSKPVAANDLQSVVQKINNDSRLGDAA